MERLTINKNNEPKKQLIVQNVDWPSYYRNVLSDFREMKTFYPFSFLIIPPTVNPVEAEVHVIAANKRLIARTEAIEDDFKGIYSRELHLIIPVNYRQCGCKVYGAKWLDTKRFQYKDIHFSKSNKQVNLGYELCVGPPESFQYMDNVILENVKTAENMLIAYERVMIGDSKTLELIAYSHGNEGKEEFKRDRHRYISKRIG